MSEPDVTQPSDDPLDAIICEYLEAAERGQPPSQAAFLARHAQFAPQLREFFSDWQGFPAVADGSASDVTSVEGRNAGDGSLGESTISFELDDFELVREIGRGGMGQVFEARQKSLRRSVAIKAMAIGKTSARHGRLGRKAADRNTQELRGRFLREAEVTGGLQHPGIVPVYAVGAALDGQPFYAMRLIEGESLHDAIENFHAAIQPGEDFVRTRGLEFRRLLRRVIDVCNAIDYAHSQQVIHRDIKPRNVMLGRFGETLVVDWGLAKLAGGTNLGDTLPLPAAEHYTGTHQGSAVGTPAFMSPEQASGELDRLGPASDVYSLGATLYCLLTGQPAFVGKDLLAIFEQIKRGEFPRPREVRSTIPSALEAICLKAMAHDRSKRYTSAAAMGDDLDRWLNDEPVSAYQERFLERGARWARRHRTWIRAAVVTLLLLAIGGAASAWVINSAREETEIRRQQAVRRLAQARRATETWLTGVSELIKDYPAMEPGRRWMLEEAARAYDDFAEGADDDPDLELERGRAKLRLGEVRLLLDERQSAEQAYRSALELFDNLLREQPQSEGARLEALNSRVRLAQVVAENNKLAEADQLYGEAIAIANQLVIDVPERFECREAWLSAHVDRAVLSGAQGRWNDSEALVSQASDRLTEWLTASPADLRYHQLQAKLATVAGEVAIGQGNWAEAYAMLERASKSLSQLINQDSTHRGYHSDHGSTLVQMAVAARALGRTDDELEAYQSALAEYQLLAETFGEVPLYQENLALTKTDLAQIQLLLGETKAALELAQSAIEIFRNLVETSDLPRYLEGLGAATDVLGQIQLDRGERSEAYDSFLLAEARFNELLKVAPDETNYRHRWAVVQSHLAQALLLAGDLSNFNEAEERYAKARNALAELTADASFPAMYRQSAALVEYHCGSLLFEADQKEAGSAALASAKRHFQLLVDSPPPPPEYLDQFATFLVECVDPNLCDFRLAEQLSRRTIEIANKNPEMHTTLAAALFRQQRTDEVGTLLKNAITQRPSARAYFWLALNEAARGEMTTAREQLKLGQAWMQEHRPANQELLRLRQEAEQAVEARKPS